MIEPLPWYLLNATWLSLPLVVAALLAGRWLMLYLGGKRARSQAQETRVALGEPIEALRASCDGKVVTLRGELVVEAGPCNRYQDEAPAAASTMQVSAARTWGEETAFNPHSDRRADRLYLATAEARVPLAGAVTVLAGSHEYWPAASIGRMDPRIAQRVEQDAGYDPRSFDGFPVFRSLRDGDAVLVRGKLLRHLERGGPGGSYREQAASWELQPASIAIELAAVKHPRFATKERLELAGPGMALAAALFAFVWLFVDLDPADARSACWGPCESWGACRPTPEWSALGIGLSCAPSAHPPCQLMLACSQHGQCIERDGRCVAESDEDCRKIPNCAERGRCSVEEGRCATTSDADCRQTERCAEEGWCSLVGEGDDRHCGFGSNEDCARNRTCRLLGQCTFAAGHCVAADDEDCQRSRYCQEEGLCASNGEGACIAVEHAHCRASQACLLRGRCHAVEGHCDMLAEEPPPAAFAPEEPCDCAPDDLQCHLRCAARR